MRVDVTGTEDDKTNMTLVLNGNRTVVPFERFDTGADKVPRCWLDDEGNWTKNDDGTKASLSVLVRAQMLTVGRRTLRTVI
jgi:hypothetical protein